MAVEGFAADSDPGVLPAEVLPDVPVGAWMMAGTTVVAEVASAAVASAAAVGSPHPRSVC